MRSVRIFPRHNIKDYLCAMVLEIKKLRKTNRPTVPTYLQELNFEYILLVTREGYTRRSQVAR